MAQRSRLSIQATPAGRAIGGLTMFCITAAGVIGSPLLSGIACVLVLALLLSYRIASGTANHVKHWQLSELQWHGSSGGQSQRFSIDVTSGPGQAITDITLTLESDGFEQAPSIRLNIPAQAKGQVVFESVMPEPGQWFIRALRAEWNDRHALFCCTRVFRLRCAVNINFGPAKTGVRHVGRPEQRPTTHTSVDGANQRSPQGEIREVRAYTHGDPRREIAWKPSARLGRLLVRQRELGERTQAYVLVNVGPAMRHGKRGERPVEKALATVSELVRRHKDCDFGFIAFDHRVISHLAPSSGPLHRAQLSHHLLSALAPVDPDLTEICDVEVLALVGRFLRERLAWGFAPNAYLEPGQDLIANLNQTVDPIALTEAMQFYARRYKFDVMLPAQAGIGQLARAFCKNERLQLPYRLSGPDLASRKGFQQGADVAMRAHVERLYILDCTRAMTSTNDHRDIAAAARRRGIEFSTVTFDGLC
ncbi:MAG: DUF58 domain-containing protein [Bradymonadia bacterium]